MLNDQLSIIYLPLHLELLSRLSRRSRRKPTIKVIIQVVVLEMRSEMLWFMLPLASECINLVFYISRSLLYSLPFAMLLHSPYVPSGLKVLCHFPCSLWSPCILYLAKVANSGYLMRVWLLQPTEASEDMVVCARHEPFFQDMYSTIDAIPIGGVPWQSITLLFEGSFRILSVADDWETA